MTTAAAQGARERRLWLALGVSAVLQLATMAVVAALVLSPERFLLRERGEAAAPGGRRAGRQLQAAMTPLASVMHVDAAGVLVIDAPVAFKGDTLVCNSSRVDFNGMVYANWFKVDTLARLTRVQVEDDLTANVLAVTAGATIGGELKAEDLLVSGTAQIGTQYAGQSEYAGVVLNVNGAGQFGAPGTGTSKGYVTEVAPGQVKTTWLATKEGSGPSCTLGRSWADVQMDLTKPAAPSKMCSDE